MALSGASGHSAGRATHPVPEVESGTLTNSAGGQLRTLPWSMAILPAPKTGTGPLHSGAVATGPNMSIFPAPEALEWLTVE